MQHAESACTCCVQLRRNDGFVGEEPRRCVEEEFDPTLPSLASLGKPPFVRHVLLKEPRARDVREASASAQERMGSLRHRRGVRTRFAHIRAWHADEMVYGFVRNTLVGVHLLRAIEAQRRIRWRRATSLRRGRIRPNPAESGESGKASVRQARAFERTASKRRARGKCVCAGADGFAPTPKRRPTHALRIFVLGMLTRWSTDLCATRRIGVHLLRAIEEQRRIRWRRATSLRRGRIRPNPAESGESGKASVRQARAFERTASKRRARGKCVCAGADGFAPTPKRRPNTLCAYSCLAC